MPANQIVIGMPTYGQSWTLTSETRPRLGAPGGPGIGQVRRIMIGRNLSSDSTLTDLLVLFIYNNRVEI